MQPLTMQRARRRAIVTAFGAGALLLTAAAHRRLSLVEVRRDTRVVGVESRIVVVGHCSAAAEAACERAATAVAEVDRALSLYRADSDLRCLNRDGRIALAGRSHLDTALRAALAVSAQTDGAFDPTVQPLWDVYSDASRRRQLPDEGAIHAARSCVDWRRVALLDEGIVLDGPGMAITLNGIAQGYAADVALRACRADGIVGALVDTGEIATFGRRSDDRPWRLAIEGWSDVEHATAAAVSTSSDRVTTFTDDAVHHHIFDPASGRSPRELSQVSVAAPSAAAADAWSTAFMVMGLSRSRAFLAAQTELSAVFRTKSGIWSTSGGFTRIG